MRSSSTGPRIDVQRLLSGRERMAIELGLLRRRATELEAQIRAYELDAVTPWDLPPNVRPMRGGIRPRRPRH